VEFIDVIKSRHSIRNYNEQEVEDEKITYILECARLAPSWVNKQCWRFIVVKDKGMITALSKTSFINRWMKNVPVVVVACADPTESGTNNGIDYSTVDVSIAFEHLVLAATDVGLGTCWMAGYDEEKVKQLLEIPKRIRVIAITPVGYPLEKKGIVQSITGVVVKTGKRKSLEEIVHHEKW